MITLLLMHLSATGRPTYEVENGFYVQWKIWWGDKLLLGTEPMELNMHDFCIGIKIPHGTS